MTGTHTLVITVISGGRGAGRREREGERWGGELGEASWGREVGRRDGGERWGGERERERGGEERERERGGERGWEVILLIKEVCEGQ